MGEARGTFRGQEVAYRVLVGRPEGKRPLGRPRHRREDDIKVDIREVVWGGMGWIVVAANMDRWRALVNVLMNLRPFYNAGNFLTG
jgi:hypothetical protein